MDWSESEIRETIRAYFFLMGREERNELTNKAALYRELSAKIPVRTPKAFELKFQNISAILYELKLPFCNGLKPASNYQRLLKLLVLDYLDRSPIPPVEPIKILQKKIAFINSNGPITTTGKSSGRFGLAIEKALGIPPNSDKAPDFMGIELKSEENGVLQTLFSRTPTKYSQDADKNEMFERYARFDAKRKRHALYTSFSSKPDSYGFSLAVDFPMIRAIRNGKSVLEYEAEKIEEALLSKHAQTAFLAVQSIREGPEEQFTIGQMTYCKGPSVIRFMRLVDSGKIFLDLTMAKKPTGQISDHGFLWRIRAEALPELYLSTERMGF